LNNQKTPDIPKGIEITQNSRKLPNTNSNYPKDTEMTHTCNTNVWKWGEGKWGIINTNARR